jgi:hypothetical protein
MAERSQINRLGDILVQSPSTGAAVPLRELGRFERRTESHIIYNKDLRPVEYVVADVGGRLAAPIYGMLQVEEKLEELGCRTPDGVDLCDHIYYTGPPSDDSSSAIEWAGEWTVTYETFRDMGIAFGAALILIYILVVWEFGNFRIPALIMAPIPLTLLGIIPAHTLFFQMGWGGEFTATSMIGWIALAGIIVRNSILLVDFSVHRIQEGDSVVDAVISACKTRTRPILITALALVAGSSVIFFDPIFQGMAISLASGVLVSTLLTLVVIPLGCVAAADSLCAVAGSNKCRKFSDGEDPEGGPGGPQGGARVGDPLWVRAWGGFASVLFAVVGAVATLAAWLTGLFKRTSKQPAGTASQAAEDPVQKASAPIPSDRAAEASSSASASGADASLAARPAVARKAAANKAPAKRASAKKAAAKKASAKKASAKKATTRKVNAKKAPATGRAVGSQASSKEKPQTGRAGTGQAAQVREAGARDGAVVRKTGTRASSPAAKPGMGATRKKGSGRRGIQLKSLGKQGDDGLN